MQVELPRHTPVEDRIYLILNVDSRKFLDPYLVLADIEFPIRTLGSITLQVDHLDPTGY